MIMSISLAVHTVVILGAPGYFGERILVEVERIKLILADELVKNCGKYLLVTISWIDFDKFGMNDD